MLTSCFHVPILFAAYLFVPVALPGCMYVRITNKYTLAREELAPVLVQLVNQNPSNERKNCSLSTGSKAAIRGNVGHQTTSQGF